MKCKKINIRFIITYTIIFSPLCLQYPRYAVVEFAMNLQNV